MKAVIRLNVNGVDHELFVPLHKTLLEVIREELGLTGTKHGCELGECGACTVLVDGVPLLSCITMPVDVQGKKILTVEGMGTMSNPHPLQSTFTELGAAQCGYCTPGMLLVGNELTCELIDTVADVAFKAAKPIDNTDMGPAYRKLMARVLTRRALRQLA